MLLVSLGEIAPLAGGKPVLSLGQAVKEELTVVSGYQDEVPHRPRLGRSAPNIEPGGHRCARPPLCR